MMDGQLMGEFEAEVKELEADSWSLGVEQQYLQQLDKELVKRQDVIYGAFRTSVQSGHFKGSTQPSCGLGLSVAGLQCN